MTVSTVQFNIMIITDPMTVSVVKVFYLVFDFTAFAIVYKCFDILLNCYN